ncbi:hypothetical protein AN217_18455 [Streptomyces qinglanensis]|uniref:Uncharacterized protein n=1 Tax=Streptomyces qinglanensis TaxID=943816 RepID=A0A1E7K6D3_9ACTN|nr:hypothetical protein [Streptomyces qinglanensis]OEU99469.1 hypothetical protein AN217_18455 [Streptomyces qinglanensis]
MPRVSRRPPGTPGPPSAATGFHDPAPGTTRCGAPRLAPHGSARRAGDCHCVRFAFTPATPIALPGQELRLPPHGAVAGRYGLVTAVAESAQEYRAALEKGAEAVRLEVLRPLGPPRGGLG